MIILVNYLLFNLDFGYLRPNYLKGLHWRFIYFVFLKSLRLPKTIIFIFHCSLKALVGKVSSICNLVIVS